MAVCALPAFSLLLMNSSSPTPRKRRERFLVYGKDDVVVDWLVHFLTQLMAVVVFLLSLISAKAYPSVASAALCACSTGISLGS